MPRNSAAHRTQPFTEIREDPYRVNSEWGIIAYLDYNSLLNAMPNSKQCQTQSPISGGRGVTTSCPPGKSAVKYALPATRQSRSWQHAVNLRSTLLKAWRDMYDYNQRNVSGRWFSENLPPRWCPGGFLRTCPPAQPDLPQDATKSESATVSIWYRHQGAV